MNTRQLRAALFHMTDQTMTVKEIRAMLFGIRDQDAELDLSFGMWAEIEAEYAKAKKLALEMTQ